MSNENQVADVQVPEARDPGPSCVITSIGSIGDRPKVQVLKDLDRVRFGDWMRSVAGRYVIVDMPYADEPLIPAWVLRAVFDAAPADAMFSGIHYDAFSGSGLQVRICSASFPKTAPHRGLTSPIPHVRAEWDLVEKTITVEWPQRTD